MKSYFFLYRQSFFSRAVILLLLVTGLSPLVKAQSDQDLVEVADEMYKFGDIKDALEIYKQAVEKNPSNAYANYMSGRCYLETIHKEKSLPFLTNAYDQDSHIAFNILYLIATSYHLGYNFEKAIEYYEKYRTKLLNEREDDKFKAADELKKVERRVEECRNGIEFLKNPVNVRIENMGAEINSAFEDYAPVISADQSLLFFTSRRTGSTGGNKANDNEFFEDIYVARRKENTWTPAENIGTSINSQLHEASIGLSPDGKILFIYKDDNKHTGDIFMCKLDSKGKWSKAVSIGNEINSEYIENSVTISKDGKTLFFASNRPGGKGGMDIYVSHQLKNGKWGKPENLGDVVNTEYDDEGPFIDADGKTLFFSSKAHRGMGGFDIYKSVYDEQQKQWSEPENLGYPINSPDDDIYFVVSGDDQIAYYASVKDEGLEKAGVGDVDLFRIYLNAKLPKDSIKLPQPITLNNFKKNAYKNVNLTIAVKSKDGKLPLDAKIEIFEMKSNTILSRGASKEGKYDYTFSNSEEKEYLITVSREGYMYKKETVVIPASTDKEQDILVNVNLDKVKVGNRFILRNIYYEFDKASLQSVSYTELNKLYTFLKDNPGIKIEIDGHTDSKGSIEYNRALSQSRAESVRHYLTRKGIAAHRISCKGLGKSKPLASNDDEEEGRELNRRTEILILSK